MDKKTRGKYSPEFKREAVMLANQPGQTITGVAQNLGVGAGLIQRWNANSVRTVNKRLWVKGLRAMKRCLRCAENWCKSRRNVIF